MEPMEIFWLAACVIFLVVEAVTPSLVSIWFGIGALVSLIAAAIGAELWLQIVLFLAVSAITLAATRPLAKKFLDKKHQATNADMVIGKIAVVTEEIDNVSAKGAATCMGKEWSARSKDASVIPAGTKVKVLSIEGVKLIVKQAD